MENKTTTDRFRTYEEIPLFLDGKMIARLLGISPSTAYAMLNDQAFPAIKIGRRRLVRKEKLFEWLQSQETDVAKATDSYFARNPFRKNAWSNYL